MSSFGTVAELQRVTERSTVGPEMFVKTTLVIAAMELAAMSPAFAQSDVQSELHKCRNSDDFNDKIYHCSNVIGHTGNRRYLEIAYNSRGFAYMQAKRFADAASDFSSVIGLNPSIAGYYDNRQNAYRSAGRFEEAMRDANSAIQLAPTYSFVYRGRGNVYNDMGQYAVAIADYNRAIQISPGDGGLFIDRGKIFARIGRPQDAISDFSHALELDEKWIAAYRERGLTFKQLGQLDAALRDLTIFVQLQPDDQEAVQSLADLRSAITAPIQPSLPASVDPAPIQSQTQRVIAEPPRKSPEAQSNASPSEVPMQKSGGTFLIPVSINGALTLDFIIDSGASDVSIPADVVLTLMRTGTLRSEDFLGSKTYQLADGSTVPSETFKIRTLKVGGREIEDVTGSVAKIEGSLLLGQSFLSRFKSWSIDNERGMLMLR